MRHLTKILMVLLLAFCLILTACGQSQKTSSHEKKVQNQTVQVKGNKEESFDLSNIPAFSGKPYVVIHNNVPDFPDKDKTKKSFERYSELDSLGRCGPAYANIGKDLMPTKKGVP